MTMKQVGKREEEYKCQLQCSIRVPLLRFCIYLPLKVFNPSLTVESSSISKCSNSIFSSFNKPTMVRLNPHCGDSGLPFMNRTTCPMVVSCCNRAFNSSGDSLVEEVEDEEEEFFVDSAFDAAFLTAVSTAVPLLTNWFKLPSVSFIALIVSKPPTKVPC